MRGRVFAASTVVMAALMLCGSFGCGESFAAGDAFMANIRCVTCHRNQWTAMQTSGHATFRCADCHEGAEDHTRKPFMRPAVHFDLTFCGKCHQDQLTTYMKDEPGRTWFGGGVNPPELWPKTSQFWSYNSIIDGYGFVKEYNEERAHAWMLTDHKNITRFKFDTCLQCKSTKATYYWGNPTPRTVKKDVVVMAGHFPGEVVIPAGTRVIMGTDRVTPYPQTGQPNHEVRVTATLPDGRIFSSYDYYGAVSGKDKDPEKAMLARIMTWGAVYALTVDEVADDSPTVSAGVACNHCHDPHGTKLRIIRQSLKDAIGRRGINPYAATKVYSFEAASPADRKNTVCAQCHVEYVCGHSSVDKIDRDYFPWAKAADLHSIYMTNFAYNMDWTHGVGTRPWQMSDPMQPGFFQAGTRSPINEPLIKSQHPETETYWNSVHYAAGASCPDCHMGKTKNAAGRTFTSHWCTSPIRLLKKGVNTCTPCHAETPDELVARVETIQQEIFTLQHVVQDELVKSLQAIALAKGLQKDATAAVEQHRQAHVRWENLIVSENSMGFHNAAEVRKEMEAAIVFARKAQELAKQ